MDPRRAHLRIASVEGWGAADLQYSRSVKVQLRDRNGVLVEAWKRHFDGVEAVTATQGDIFGDTADAIVSPANSFGYMDGGIDGVYAEHFGIGLEPSLRKLLAQEHGGELPVGSAVLVATGASDIPWMVSAPTMRVPGPVPNTLNAFLAFRAALRCVVAHNTSSSGAISSVLCPGLATAIGKMPADRCARQMRFAYDIVLGGRPWPGTVATIYESHREMLR